MTQEQHAAFEPCPNPWCNSRKTTDKEIMAAERPILMPSSIYEWAVACPVCPIQTPWFSSEEVAIAAWNRRATPKSSESGLLDEAVTLLREIAEGKFNCSLHQRFMAAQGRAEAFLAKAGADHA